MTTMYTKHSPKNNIHRADDPDALLTIPEVAHILRVDPTTCRRWINAGVLDAVALPNMGKWRSYRVRQRTIDEMLGEKGA
jgi:excisionase family DNA binding protein